MGEWKILKLGEVASFSKGQGLSKNQLSESGSRSCLLYGELFTTYGRVIDSVVSRTNSYEGAMSRFGDVLLPGSTTTTGADLATASALLLDDVQLSGDVNIIRPDLMTVNPIYLAYHLTVEQRDAIAMRTQGITIHHLYGKHLADLDIRLPSLAEQTAIAKVLTDTAENVAQIDALIIKKKHLLIAVLQQLLSASTRLHGFNGEWKILKLGEVASFSKGQGLSKNQLSESGSRSCLLYGELFTTYGRVIDSVVSRTNSYEGAMSRFGDVLLPGSTTTTGADLATASALLLDDVQLSGDVNIIRPDLMTVNPIYLAYHLTVEQRDAIAMRTQGITIHHLYGKHLADLDIRLPSLAEQTAIAKVLTDMQLNIEALEKQRSKAEMIKLGMMSDLLSGKVRLT